MRSWYAVRVGDKWKLLSAWNKKLKYYDNRLGLNSGTRYGALKELDVLKAEYAAK